MCLISGILRCLMCPDDSVKKVYLNVKLSRNTNKLVLAIEWKLGALLLCLAATDIVYSELVAMNEL
jgi:hypothetical protein